MLENSHSLSRCLGSLHHIPRLLTLPGLTFSNWLHPPCSPCLVFVFLPSLPEPSLPTFPALLALLHPPCSSCRSPYLFLSPYLIPLSTPFLSSLLSPIFLPSLPDPTLFTLPFLSAWPNTPIFPAFPVSPHTPYPSFTSCLASHSSSPSRPSPGSIYFLGAYPFTSRRLIRLFGGAALIRILMEGQGGRSGAK
ncbi:hypothetical protein E2C01_074611 [Portunus trituberculatus]|uniref:Uncharacterized protein n=1 Tax=Portunus trituberculatus TaxID=210409 RepID=A0A5B7IER1_PORTR|nr:hypothetical protein [Portunus trituberculatus]